MTAAITAGGTDSRAQAALLGQRVREARQRCGMTQHDLARALSARLAEPISRSTIGNYEIGRRPLPADLLLQIAEICAVPLDTFAPAGAASTPRPPAAPPQLAQPEPAAANSQALALINQSLQARPDLVPFVLELIAGMVEEPPQP